MNPLPGARPKAPIAPLIDPSRLLFSLSSFLAAALTLVITLMASLPRPWWAMLTVYVTAQPMAGDFRPKVLYRLGGIALGALVTLILVPNLQNSPALLVLCLASWTGFSIYFAVLDRTPRAFLFQMSAFSAAVISFPYLDDPGAIFETTIARVQEMVIAILSVTAVHAVLQPWSATPMIRARAESFLDHARQWMAEAIGEAHAPVENEHRRRLAADVTELGMLAVHLPFDQRRAPATRRRIADLQHQLARILPLVSAASNRLGLLRARGDCPPVLQALLADSMVWLRDRDSRAVDGFILARRGAHRAEAIETQITGMPSNWGSLLEASACIRLAEALRAIAVSRRLAERIGMPGSARGQLVPAPFALARDHTMAALAGLATALAIMIYCSVWIVLGWPNGSATAAFAALITCSFATQDDPAPTIARYLWATLKTYPLAALYLFVILPRVDGIGMLILTLAPALIWMGCIQANPARTAQALPMFSCFIVAMGFLARFQADFATFVNTGLAQTGGIVTTLVVTKLFRTTNAAWTARRIARANWADMAELADIHRPFHPALWTAKAIDRFGQFAARIALAPPGDALHETDGLADLRVGRNIIPLRRALAHVPHDLRHSLAQILGDLAAACHMRRRRGRALVAPDALLTRIDTGLRGLLALPPDAARQEAVRALVGMRCNLFPQAGDFTVRAR